MKIAAVNALPKGSPATIMRRILQSVETEHQAEGKSFYGHWRHAPSSYQDSERFGFLTENLISFVFARQNGIYNMGSVFGTLQLLRRLKRFHPDLIHLHNLHLSDVNVPLLFRFIKRNAIPVVWTLHDCWAFTGRCPYFDLVCCDKWKSLCVDCPYPPTNYPPARRDATTAMWRRKRKWFHGVENMTIVTPSNWLGGLVKLSYLKDYPLQVIHNGIDLETFRPVESSFRKEHQIPEDGRMLLGVAFDWGFRKGLDVFLALERYLTSKDRIVLVGTDEKIDSLLPKSFISIHRTDSAKKLAEIYSSADVFVNPTREDNYPTVNLEAIACGTPVVTFRTGGSPEAPDESCGIVVPKDDTEAMWEAVNRICADPKPWREGCLRRAKSFSEKECYRAYWELYQNIITGGR